MKKTKSIKQKIEEEASKKIVKLLEELMNSIETQINEHDEKLSTTIEAQEKLNKEVAKIINEHAILIQTMIELENIVETTKTKYKKR